MSVELHSESTSRPAADLLVAGASPGKGRYVYVSFVAPLFDYCAGLLGNQAEAAGAVQDSLVAVNAQISKMPEPDRLRVALYAAARRQCLSRGPGRRSKLTGPSGTTAARQLGVTAPDAGVPAPDAGVPASDAGVAAPDASSPRTVDETLAVVTAALARLPDRDREVLNLAFRHQMAEADLAAVLGLSSRRTQSLLSGASDRFGKSAAVAVVLRAGMAGGAGDDAGDDAGCPVLAGIVSQQDAVKAPLTAKFVRLNRHIESCPGCVRNLGDRAFPPDLVSQVPLTAPAEQLRLRMIRTALALGTYRRRMARAGGGAGSDLPPDPVRRGPGTPRGMAAASMALAILAVPGVLLVRHELNSAPGPVPVRVASGVQSPSPVSPELSLPSGPSSPRPPLLPALPGAGPTPLGVLPVATRGGSSADPVPLSQSASPPPGASPSQSPSSQPSATPTTASPTPSPAASPTPTPTPDPTPDPTPTSTPDPAPTSTPTPSSAPSSTASP